MPSKKLGPNSLHELAVKLPWRPNSLSDCLEYRCSLPSPHGVKICTVAGSDFRAYSESSSNEVRSHLLPGGSIRGVYTHDGARRCIIRPNDLPQCSKLAMYQK